MIQELLALGFPMGKYILAAALMVVFYWFLFREKATFNNCRLYLLSIALVAILISQFSIVVYTPPAEIVEIEAVQTMPIISNNQYSNNQPVISQAPVSTASPKPVEKVAEPNKYLALLTVKNIVLAVYSSVTSILFILLLIQLFSILALKRRGKLTVKDGFEMVESAEIPTPFSFYKTIFLSPNLTGSKLEMILKHEQWHIKHRHYLDVFIIEILVRLFWFNPVLWWVRRELRNVSEFHADRSVLDEGQDLYKYQTVILEEVMENNPYLANGFNNSFTKKRFIMMKNKCHIRFATLRRALILPFFIGVFSLLCFTTGISQVKYKTKSTSNIQAESYLKDTLAASTVSEDSTFTIDSSKVSLPGDMTFSVNSSSVSKQQVEKALDDCSRQTAIAIKELNKLLTNNNLTAKKEGLNLVFKNLGTSGEGLNIGQLPLSNEFLSSITKEDLKNFSNSLSVMKTNVDRLKKEGSTAVKVSGFQQQVMSLLQNQFFSKIFSEAMQLSMPKVIETRSSNGTTTKVTRVYNNGSTTTTETTSSPEMSQAIKERKERKELDEKIWNEAYRARPEQFTVSDIPFSTRETKVARIERNKNDTRVTLAIPIEYHEQWIYFDRGFTIIDKSNGDRYLIRKLENDLPLDKTIIISDKYRKIIEITMIFPPLRKSVDTVNIIQFNTPGTVRMSDNKNDWNFMNISVPQSSGKVFK
ncbi:MAG: hypothetical protein JZU53_03835 [Paludibacter sp.]|nr:hypothetical protein [Paludibacter sp.]